MQVSPHTTAFMKALPASLRPNPFNIDENVMEAIVNGWTTDSLARACYENERNPNPAFVVTNLRNLCKLGPAIERQRKPWIFGHVPCGEVSHGPTCEICRCVPGETTHMVPSKMPADMAEAIKKMLDRRP